MFRQRRQGREGEGNWQSGRSQHRWRKEGLTIGTSLAGHSIASAPREICQGSRQEEPGEHSDRECHIPSGDSFKETG